MRSPVKIAFVGVALALAGCATSPPMAGIQVIDLEVGQGADRTAGTALASAPGFGWGTAPFSGVRPLDGVQCDAGNDRGSWRVAAPGKLEVAVSPVPLKITCRRDGYHDFAIEFSCITPRQRSMGIGSSVGLWTAMMVAPVAAVAAPSLAVAAAVAPPVVGGATGAAVAGPNADLCYYAGKRELRLQVVMILK